MSGIITLQDELAAEAVFCRDEFKYFVRGAWHVVEPKTPLTWGPHMDAICEHLTALHTGDIQNLIINVPPRHGKSTLVSVMWPAWMWIQDPRWRHLHASYDAKLATRDAQKTRELLSSPWFQSRFDPSWQFTGDQNTKSLFKNSLGGYRLATSVNASSATGWGGDNTTIDDPMPVNVRASRKQMLAVYEWFIHQWYNRVEDPKLSTRLVTGQRTDSIDLSGMLLEHHANDWEHLMLPTRYEARRARGTKIDWKDKRHEEGELLFPDRFGEKEVQQEEALGEFRFATQHQQNPVTRSGNLFKNKHIGFWMTHEHKPISYKDSDGNICFYRQMPLPRVENMEMLIQSWDMAFLGNPESDRVAGQVWGRLAPHMFLLDQVATQMWFDESVEAVEKMAAKWPQCTGIFIEKAANGAAAINTLEKKFSGVEGVPPRGGKVARAQAVLPLMQNVWLPHPAEKSWATELVDTLLVFDRGDHDDEVDALTQGLTALNTGSYAPRPKLKVTVLGG